MSFPAGKATREVAMDAQEKELLPTCVVPASENQ